jgi:DNA (cytosine-5)-methyltransferase 1
VVRAKDGRLRRLTPVELERLNGFRPGWTEGMPDGRRAFMMGNALVVGLVTRVGASLQAGVLFQDSPASFSGTSE